MNITCIVWAPGEGPLILQENLGGPLFGSTGFSAFSIEIHYNNPGTYAAFFWQMRYRILMTNSHIMIVFVDLDTGVYDSSGVRFYYTDQLREFEIGIMQVGGKCLDSVA